MSAAPDSETLGLRIPARNCPRGDRGRRAGPGVAAHRAGAPRARLAVAWDGDGEPCTVKGGSPRPRRAATVKAGRFAYKLRIPRVESPGGLTVCRGEFHPLKIKY